MSEIVFSDHVPAGKKPCSACCEYQRGLAVQPGYFRDFDVDCYGGRFGVCIFCGGTGIEINMDEKTRDTFHQLRWARTNSQQQMRDIATGKQQVKDPAKELEALMTKLQSPLLHEEFYLLCLASELWRINGKPNGVYAEKLDATLTEVLTAVPRQTFSDDELAPFQFNDKDVPNGLNGLTPALLADLHDMATKYGEIDPIDRLFRFSGEPTRRFLVTASAKPNNHTMILGQHDDGKIRGLITFCRKNNESPNALYYAGELSVAEIDRFIRIADYMACAMGMASIDHSTGKRTRLVNRVAFQQAKFIVEEAFAQRGSAMPALGQDPEKLRQQFDTPDKVAILKEAGYTVLCHVRDVEYINKRTAIATAIMKERGIAPANSEALADLPVETIIAIRAETDERMSKPENSPPDESAPAE